MGAFNKLINFQGRNRLYNSSPTHFIICPFFLEQRMGWGSEEPSLGNNMPSEGRSQSSGYCYVSHEAADTPSLRSPETHGN